MVYYHCCLCLFPETISTPTTLAYGHKAALFTEKKYQNIGVTHFSLFQFPLKFREETTYCKSSSSEFSRQLLLDYLLKESP